MVERPSEAKAKEDDEWRESDQSENEVLLILPIAKEPSPVRKAEEESFWLITLQVFFPFLIAGLGMVGAGLVLDVVQASIIYYSTFSSFFEYFKLIIGFLHLYSIGKYFKL